MLFFAVAFSVGIALPDSTRPIQQLAHKTWTAQDGAPSGIHVLAETKDGYLWLGTAFGLVRFDGVRFTPVQPEPGDSLAALGVRDLLGTRDGNLWIVWETGTVSRFADGKFTSYGVRDGLAAVRQLAESSDGELIAGTAAGLSRLTNGKWRETGAEWGFGGTEAWAVWFDSKDALWVETADRVVYRPKGAPAFVDPGQPLANTAWQADFDEAADGTIWMAELGSAAHTVRRAGESTPPTDIQVGTFTLLIDRKGSLWVGSRGDGLRRVLDPSRIRGRSIAKLGTEAERFTEKDGLLSNVLWDLLEDREGSIWVASDRGLERFREGPLVPFVTPGGVRPRSVFASRDSSVWTAEYAISAVTRIDPRGRHDTAEAPCWCYRMAQDSAGSIWAFNDVTIVRFDGLKPTQVSFDGERLAGIEAMAIDPAGTLWISARNAGLVRRIGNRLERVVPAGELGRATALISDRKGRIWAGAGSRVALYDHGKLSLLDPDNGIRAGQITDVYEDRTETIWASGSSGIHKFERGSFRKLSPHQSPPGEAVFAMREDNAGAWWLATRTGLLRIDPGELERAFADTAYALRYRVFDRLDGLPGTIPTTKLPVLTRSLDGKIWIAADEGVAAIDPSDLSRYKFPFHVIVEAVRFKGRESVPDLAQSIPAGAGDLEIDYTATALSVAERVQFRYRLDGADTAWRDVGARRRAYYTALAPGSYRFRVSANNGDGNWVETSAPWSFQVLPAWYQTTAFRAIAVLVIGGLGGLLVALVQRRRHTRSEAELRRQYEITLAERQRIAEDLHDTLLQGFAGVNLQLIAAELALPSQPEVAAETIIRVQRLTEESLREARERVWEMREASAVSDNLPAALETLARDRTANTPIQIAVTTSGNSRHLPRSLEDASFRIGREAIVNAVRHAQPSRIDIHLDFGASAFNLEVRDDGRGVSAVEAAAARKRGHFGLMGMESRASHLGGRCEVRPRPGGGTIVDLVLPLTADGGGTAVNA